MKKDYSKYFKTPDAKEARKRKHLKTEEIHYVTHSERKQLGVHKTYLIETYGCQGNEADSETMAGILEDMGFIITASEETAKTWFLKGRLYES